MRKFLLVDDNVAFAENTAEILRDLGADVMVAATPDEALSRAREGRFDAVVTDMRMPSLDGAELLRELRRVDPGLPAVVLTAFSSDESLERARREGVYAVLQKPVEVHQLIELLGRVRRNALVMLVEDDAALRENLSETLRGRGFSVVEAGSDAEVRTITARACCAVVDVRLPDARDGEAMTSVRASRPELPVIAITGFDLDGPLEGVRAFLRKPFIVDALVNEVERACARGSSA